jgi:hypothetical protein
MDSHSTRLLSQPRRPMYQQSSWIVTTEYDTINSAMPYKLSHILYLSAVYVTTLLVAQLHIVR